MIISMDLRPLQEGFKAHKARGIGVYTMSLAERKSAAPAGLEIAGFHDPRYESADAERCGSSPLCAGRVATMARKVIKELATQRLFMRRAIDKIAKEQGAGLIFFPTHLDAPGGLKTPYAVTAHDMIQSALRDKYYSSLKHRLHVAWQTETLRKAKLVITVSASAKADVIRHAGIDPAKIKVVYNGVDGCFHPAASADLSRFNLPEKFVLNVGGIDFRKNVDLLFYAFGKLLETNPDAALVMTGAIESDPQYGRFVSALKSRGLASRAKAIGYVTKEELAALYAKATVFFYPSLYEGFGLPVLEAMACGAPVITTNRSSLPEVAGDAAILLDPSTPDNFAKSLRQLFELKAMREDFSAKGIKRAAMFSWDRCASETFALLSGVAGKK